ncbi:MAG: cytochrome c biogenesis protein CcsA [Bacteroidaceae bacterium]|nr:cytochrome c biogenesis protein CcsA [Bacteroidaceae bacterium]
MGVATIVEKIHGKDYVGEHIYGSWWFITLWGLLAILGMAFLVRMKVHKKVPVFLLHLSFVVMLAGALITHLTSQEGTVHLRLQEDVQTFIDNEQQVQHLPFTMRLEAFSIICYPGTDAVMDYRCTIEVVSTPRPIRERSGEGPHKMVVSMNNIGKAAGYRFYQSSYDDDGQGTHLLVTHDPYGIAVTYVGYLMLFVSLLWTIFSRHTRIRQLYRMATRPLVILVLFCLTSQHVFASSKPQPLSPPKGGWGVSPVSSDIAHELGKVVILYNGRLCPINTAATDFVTKLSGKPSWNGYSADEIFTGWMIFYTEWEQQKIIRIKSAEVGRLLGIEGQWASMRDFYTSEGEYKLRGKANDSSLPDATRKAIREADEKLQVISMFYGNEMLRMFPLEEKPQNPQTSEPQNLTWHSPGSTELPLGTPEREFQFINHAMDYLVQAILANDVSDAKQIIAKIRLYQEEKVGDALPSKTMVSIEVFYNKLISARWVTFMCLTLSLLFCLLLMSEKGGRVVRLFDLLYIFFLSAYLAVLFSLRWLISGHIPMSNGYETMLFMALVTLIITVLMLRRIPILQAFGPVVASFCMLVATLASGSPQITNLMPVLQSPLLSIHVAMVMIAYALLAMITLLSIQGLCLSRSRKFEQLERTTALSQLLLYPAILTLCIGIFVGAIWANVSWGTYWSWDPKETWALITLMIYAIPIHRSFVSWSPARYHLFVLLAFLTVLMTYFGVNYFLSGMHSYA